SSKPVFARVAVRGAVRVISPITDYIRHRPGMSLDAGALPLELDQREPLTLAAQELAVVLDDEPAELRAGSALGGIELHCHATVAAADHACGGLDRRAVGVDVDRDAHELAVERDEARLGEDAVGADVEAAARGRLARAQAQELQVERDLDAGRAAAIE